MRCACEMCGDFVPEKAPLYEFHLTRGPLQICILCKEAVEESGKGELIGDEL